MNSRISDLRADLRGLFTGKRTIGDSTLPPIVFVVMNAWQGLGAAVAAALVVGGLLTVVRLWRGGSLSYALGGIGVVAVAVVFALRSGRAEGYFLPGILSNSGYAVAGIVSVAARRPVLVFVSWFVRRWPLGWYWRDDVRPAYTAVTWIWIAYWASRAVVQWLLFIDGRTELLGAVRVISGLPVGIPLVVVSYIYGNRTLHRLGGPSVAEYRKGAAPPFSEQQRGF